MKEELSDFLKLAYKKGKVKEVKEAFEEFSPQNEWHKGKIEKILCEESTEYSFYEGWKKWIK